jgi:eukaryotic-like serine/threonine-protein kinase
MKLDLAQWRTLSSLLDRALDLPEPARTAWLETLAGDEAALEPLLRDMLVQKAGPETGDFIDALPPFDSVDDAGATIFAHGAIVGPYRLVRELGQGGMGEVWLAERTDGLVRRPVALKLPFLAISRGALAERFAREREILAPLVHANIARLYDAGFAADGQPYLALEYVDGIPLSSYADEKQLDVNARLALFDQVLDAVAHAHASLVLHRDLKPSNILVTAQGEVKLLDFGIAKLMADGQASESALTRFAGPALTLDYAAPEQIASLPLTIAADVYALGVVLYELLAGERPYRLKRGTRAELEEAIAAAEPAPPSRARLTDAVAAARTTSVARLRRTLAGDLDTIVLKALKKQPGERYASVRALADDLARYRKGEPVLAQPDSFAYRASKFIVRHYVVLSASGLVATFLVGATVIAVRQANSATLEAMRAEASKNFVIQLFQGAARNNPGGAAAADTTARQLLDLGSRQVLDQSRADPELQLDLLQLLSRLNLELDLIAPASNLAERAVVLARDQYGADSLEFADALSQRADNRSHAGSYTDAISDMRDVLRIADEHPGKTRELRAKAHMIIGTAAFQIDASKPAEPQRHLETALALLKEAHSTSEDRSQAAYSLAWTFEWQRDYARAESYLMDGIAAGRENFGEKSFIVAFGYEHLADLFRQQQRLPEAREAIGKAISIYEFVLGPRHGTVAFAKTNFALIEAASGRRAEAQQMADQAVALAQDVFGEGARQVGFPAIYAARLKANRGELETAARAYQLALDVFAKNEPSTSLSNRALRIEFAEVLIALGRTERAAQLLDEAEAAFAAANDLTSVRGTWLTMARGELAYAQRDGPTGDARFVQVLREIDTRKEGGNALFPRFAAAVARTRPAPDRAEAMLTSLREHKLLPPSPAELEIDIEDKARLQYAVGRLYLAVNRVDDARMWSTSAVELRERLDAAPSPWLAEARIALAEAQHASNR